MNKNYVSPRKNENDNKSKSTLEFKKAFAEALMKN
jgi:hypothetical protein